MLIVPKALEPPTKLGALLPGLSPNDISVCLPDWSSTVRFVEGDPEITKQVKLGYPRFFFGPSVLQLGEFLKLKCGKEGEGIHVYPNRYSAERARELALKMSETKGIEFGGDLRIVTIDLYNLNLSVYALFYPKTGYPKEKESFVKEYWRRTGEGISNRMAQFVYKSLQNKRLPDPREDGHHAKQVVRARISDLISQHETRVSPSDVFLFPTGMAALFTALRLCLEITNAVSPDGSVVFFGFAFNDTIKLYQLMSPSFLPLLSGTEEDLDELEKQLANGRTVTTLFCEFPSNPVLRTPNLTRIRELADQYGFLVIVDDTISTYANVNVLPSVDITCASLTKLFNGGADLMAGSLVLNPLSRRYSDLSAANSKIFQDMLWAEDAIVLERNSRDFVQRNKICNDNTAKILELLGESPLLEKIHYPSFEDTKKNYDAFILPDGGYGCLLSLIFKHTSQAAKFYDTINIFKGPSLGTNFTLSCVFVRLAHWDELDFVESVGVNRNIVRVSIGLEPIDSLVETFSAALEAASNESPEAEKDPKLESAEDAAAV